MKFVCLILVSLIAAPADSALASTAGLPLMLAQDDGASGNNTDGTGQPDQDVTVERGAPSTSPSSNKVTPVTQNFNVQGIIMLFLMAAALFPICKSSSRGH